MVCSRSFPPWFWFPLLRHATTLQCFWLTAAMAHNQLVLKGGKKTAAERAADYFCVSTCAKPHPARKALICAREGFAWGRGPLAHHLRACARVCVCAHGVGFSPSEAKREHHHSDRGSSPVRIITLIPLVLLLLLLLHITHATRPERGAGIKGGPQRKMIWGLGVKMGCMKVSSLLAAPLSVGHDGEGEEGRRWACSATVCFRQQLPSILREGAGGGGQPGPVMCWGFVTNR